MSSNPTRSKPSPVRKFGKRTTAAEVVHGVDLTGKVAVVTGGNSGLGAETIKALAGAGAHCVLCARDLTVAQEVVARLQPDFKGNITVCQLDLADMRSVAAAAAHLAASLPTLDMLVLNAGVMALRPGPQRTADGFERQMGVNHLGHFQLAKLLLPKMKAQAKPGRVVVLASSAHKFGRIRLDDLNYAQRKYSAWGSYGASKLANVLFARELSRRLRDEGSALEVFSVHPGVIKTNIGQHLGWRAAAFYSLFGPLLKTPGQGAATSVYAATAAELAGQSGAYLQDCQLSAPAEHARDDGMAAALWEKSEELVQAALAKAGVTAAA